MASPIVGEFLGTTVLVLLGDGVNANVSLKKSYAEGAGWMDCEFPSWRRFCAPRLRLLESASEPEAARLFSG